MVEPVPAVHAWPTNAHLIEDVARLGYLDGHVLDPTFGRGRWWTRWRPQKFTASDLNTLAAARYDFRNLPHPDGSFDAVAFDPPYKLNGTPSLGDFDNAYGIDTGYVPWQDRHQMIEEGVVECLRVLKRGGHLLLKCKDQVCSGRVRWQTIEFTMAVLNLNARLVDRFDMITNPQPQPEGRRQVHARRNASTLLIFQRRT